MATNGLGLRRWAVVSGIGAIWVFACTAKDRDLSELMDDEGTETGARGGAAGADAGTNGGGGGEPGVGGSGATVPGGAAGAEPGGTAGTGATEPGGAAGAEPGGTGGQAGQGAGSAGEAGAMGGGAGGVVACVDPQTMCLGVCTDLATDAANCGVCGNDCGEGKTCADHVCVCDDEHLNCAAVCIDPNTDDDNCGGCGTECPDDRACAEGICTCAAPLIECDGRCVYPASDITNCGECGRRCSVGASCIDSDCRCPEGRELCEVEGIELCLDTSSDTNNCGGCGDACGANQVCANSECECTGGLALCDGECVNTNADGENCGQCNHTCTGGTYCVGGNCQSDCVLDICGASCVDLDTNIQHCGQCDHACALPHATQICSDGVCGLGPCDTNWYDLDQDVDTGCEYLCTSDPLVTESCSDPNLSRDGSDNDCDGDTDCAFIEATFPESGKAAAAEDVFIKIQKLYDAAVTFQCRSAKVGSELPPTWSPCPTAASDPYKVLPWTADQSSDPANDGRWMTQVRMRFTANGHVSAPTPVFQYYLHHSLSGEKAEICKPAATDAAFFSAASPYLLAGIGRPPTFAEAETYIANPFINVPFSPPTVQTLSWDLNGRDRTIEMLSLRRRFVLDAARTLLLVTRVYTSRRGSDERMACEVGMIHKHDYFDGSTYDINRQFYNHCDAWVLNRAGAGVCLDVQSSGTIRVMNPTSAQLKKRFPATVLFDDADNLMWRKLQAGGASSSDHFSPKCYTAPDCPRSEEELYLPDRDLFPGLPDLP
ncbi:MAG: hypothetical protein JW751_16745 [Polyangiaceae bacterium]|nr:hypothetical protein [Polyangiaceae bacterium]